MRVVFLQTNMFALYTDRMTFFRHCVVLTLRAAILFFLACCNFLKLLLKN